MIVRPDIDFAAMHAAAVKLNSEFPVLRTTVSGMMYQILFNNHAYECIDDVSDVKLDGDFIVLLGDVGQTLAVVSSKNLHLVKKLSP